MPTAGISCPWCSKQIASEAGFTAGSRVQCPRCKKTFALRPEDLRTATLAAAATAPPPRPATARPMAPETPASLPPWALPLGAAAVGLVVLIACGVGVVLLVGQKRPPQGAAAPAAPVLPSAPPLDDAIDPGIHRKPFTDGPPPTRPPLDLPPPVLAPPEPDQDASVQKAIDRGVAYLKNTQGKDGFWGAGYPVGSAALPGLTLLESGVPADDAHVQQAAAFVRKGDPKGAPGQRGQRGQRETYQLALAILFLDRLGESADKPLIQTMALRLIAGQLPGGGWGYECPVIEPKDEKNLLTALRKTQPTSALELIAPRSGDPAPPTSLPGVSDADARQALNALPANLRALPSLQPLPADQSFARGGGDNSCTQFAILGLWAARRHDVPMDRALALVNQRFRHSQGPNGGWGYTPGNRETPSMTAAGLLGLAVGHGVAADLQGNDPTKAGEEDPAIERGMKALSQSIDVAPGDKKSNRILPHPNMYYMWSVERVGVLYNRRTIAEKEWYPWGAEILVASQKEDGSWSVGGYIGSAPHLDTSFALLFLKRANLAQDLSTKLQFLTQIKK